MPRWVDIGLIPLANVVFALLVAGMIVLAIGENPLSAVRVMLAGALGDSEGIGYTGIVNLSRGGMLLRSVARRLGAGKSLARL